MSLHFPSLNKYTFDEGGILMALFGVLVTLLVGWNIYSTIKAKQEITEYGANLKINLVIV